MPCRSYPEDFPEEMNKLTQEKLDVVSRIACKALEYIETTDNPGLLALILQDKETADWWEAHKEADRKAKEEAAIKRKKAAEKAALNRRKNEIKAKLSPEELKILGLK